MADVATQNASHVEAFSRFEKALAGKGRDFLHPVRRQAFERFATLGFPTTKMEAWKYTSVAPVASLQFRLPDRFETNGSASARLGDLTFDPWPATHLVFTDGRCAPGLSRLRPLPPGVKVMSLAAALQSHRDLVEPHLARYAAYDEHAFAALNTAFLNDGAFIYVPKGTVVEDPIHLLYLSVLRDGGTATCPRTLIVAEEGAQLKFVESYAGFARDPHLTSAVTEIVVGDGAVVEHYKIQRESVSAYHMATIHAQIGRGAAFASHSVSLGGLLVRNDLNAVMGAEGGDCTLNGLYVTDGRQHVDNHTLIDHAKPHCSSRELYKGVLDGSSRGVFDGRIIVRKDAQKSDARQVNNNLLLSEHALVDTKPQLEINADDVKCSHAATIGQIDANALFYLRSRAIPRDEARSLLMRAFVGDVVGRIKIEALRSGLERLLHARLEKEREARAGS